MTMENQNGSGASDGQASGDGQKKDSVSYDTHKRLLEQYKKNQEKLDELSKILKTQSLQDQHFQ